MEPSRWQSSLQERFGKIPTQLVDRGPRYAQQHHPTIPDCSFLSMHLFAPTHRVQPSQGGELETKIDHWWATNNAGRQR
jgi:hypothetical protein